MTTCVLEGTQIANEQDLHRVLAAQLDFGPHYGNNLAALRDRLSKDMPRPVKIVWVNSQCSQKMMGKQAYRKVVNLFLDIEHEDRKTGLTDIFSFVLG